MNSFKKIFQDFWPLLIIALGSLALRLPFVDGSVDFFDSPQYVWRAVLPTLVEAMSSGHAPYHPGYLFFGWIIRRIVGESLTMPTIFSLINVFASTGTLVVMFLFTERLINRMSALSPQHRELRNIKTPDVFPKVRQSQARQIAWLATLLTAIAPYFWISSITVLVDPLMIFFWLLSAWLYLIWLDKDNKLSPKISPFVKGGLRGILSILKSPPAPPGRRRLETLSERTSGWYPLFQRGVLKVPFILILSGLTFGASMFVHTQIAFWVLVFPALIIIRRPVKEWFTTIIISIPWVIGPMIAIYSYALLLVHTGHNQSIAEAIIYLISGNAGDHGNFLSLAGIRNLKTIATSLILLGSIIGTIIIIRRQPRMGLGLALWLWPGTFISGAYVYTNLAGRSTMPALIPAAILTSYLLLHSPGVKKLSWWNWSGVVIVIASVLIVSTPLIFDYGKYPGVMEALNNERTKLTPGGVYVSSNETKTLHDYDKFDVVWEMPQDKIEADLSSAADNNQSIFAGTDALTYPYYVVDGLNWRIFEQLPRAYTDHGSQGAYLVDKYAFDLVNHLGFRPVGIYELSKPNTRSPTDRIQKSISSLDIGERIVFGQVDQKDSREPINHIQVNAYGSPSMHPNRVDFNDWPTQLYNQFNRLIGRKTGEPLWFGYTDAEGVVVYPLPKVGRVEKFVLVPDALETGKTFDNPPLFIDSDPVIYLIEQNTSKLSKTDLVQKLSANQNSFLTTIKRIGENEYEVNQTNFEFSLKSDNSIRAGLLPGDVGRINNDKSRNISKGGVGYATYGPWKNLSVGDYQAIWKIKRITSAPDVDTAVIIDVSFGIGAGTLSSKEVLVSELPLNNLQEIILPFTVTKESQLLEFRTKAVGGPGMVLEEIGVMSN